MNTKLLFLLVGIVAIPLAHYVMGVLGIRDQFVTVYVKLGLWVLCLLPSTVIVMLFDQWLVRKFRRDYEREKTEREKMDLW